MRFMYVSQLCISCVFPLDLFLAWVFCPIPFVCFSFILLYFIIIPYMPVCFLRRDRIGVDQDGRGCGEELGGVGRMDIMIIIYYVKKPISN